MDAERLGPHGLARGGSSVFRSPLPHAHNSGLMEYMERLSAYENMKDKK